MSRYVLRYAGHPSRHGGDSRVDIAEVVARAGGKVIDDAPDMLLVDARPVVAQSLAHLLPEWQINVESLTPMPRVPRPAVRAAVRGRRR